MPRGGCVKSLVDFEVEGYKKALENFPDADTKEAARSVDFGSRILPFMLLVWMSLTIGPWWMILVYIVGWWLLNLLMYPVMLWVIKIKLQQELKQVEKAE